MQTLTWKTDGGDSIRIWIEPDDAGVKWLYLQWWKASGKPSAQPFMIELTDARKLIKLIDGWLG